MLQAWLAAPSHEPWVLTKDCDFGRKNDPGTRLMQGNASYFTYYWHGIVRAHPKW